MSDIVERLRALNHPNARCSELGTMLAEAADEIERLRHNEAFHVERAAAQDVEVERLREVGLWHARETDRLRAEIERLSKENESLKAKLRELGNDER